jgi:hypothetical protein
MFLILLMASLPVIPMPTAGGTPILVGVMFAIFATFMTFPYRAAFLDRTDQLYIYLGLGLFLWEAIGLVAHASNSDALFVLGRGLWVMLAIALIMAMNTLYARAGMKPVTWVLVLSMLALLAAMLIEVNFFPKRAFGRDFGFFAIPFPRATGVPNSDGKLGTFLSICLCYAMFLRPPMPRWQSVVLIVGPYAGLAFLQSRSTLVALTVVTAIYLLYALMRSRSIFSAFLKLTGFLLIAGAFLINVFWLFKVLAGQGVYLTNVLGRFELYAVALRLIGEAPLFGLGADAIRQHGFAGEVHNTLLSMAVKSGVPAAVLTAVTIFAPVLLFARTNKLAVFTIAACLAMFAEHFFYPGRINEYQIFAFIVAKLAWQNQFENATAEH